jgi:hypothetical protein
LQIDRYAAFGVMPLRHAPERKQRDVVVQIAFLASVKMDAIE